MENTDKEKMKETALKILMALCGVLIIVSAVMLICRFVNDVNDISNTIYGMRADEATYSEETVVCTVAELSTIDGSKNGINYAGLYVNGEYAHGFVPSSRNVVYYYMTVTDEKDERHKFRINFSLYETLSENDTVEITVVNQNHNDGTPFDTRFYCNDYSIAYIY